MATYNFILNGGRAAYSTSEGRVIGLNTLTTISYFDAVSLTIRVNGSDNALLIAYTNISVNGTPTTSVDDATTKINTLIGTATNQATGSAGTITPVTKTTGLVSVTNSGTIATGTTFASIANVGSAVGTVKGISIPIGATVTYPASYAELNDAIAYDATSTTFLIATRR